MNIQQRSISRQRFLGGVGVGGVAVVLSACATDGENSDATGSDTGSPAAPEVPATGSDTSPAAAEVLATTTEVPVGSGVIVGDTVLTQPDSGDFKGFSALCTHRGCTLNSVSDGTINCPCHGSKFNLDGTVAQGPATRPLEAKPIVVQGDSILAG